MNEAQPLQRARRVLDRLKTHEIGSPEFIDDINVFLAVTRSVLQRAEKEAAPKGQGPKGQDRQWFHSIGQEKLIKFFAELRNVSVKEFDIVPAPGTEVTIRERVGVSDRVSCELFSANEETVLQKPDHTPVTAPPAGHRNNATIRKTAFFTGAKVEEFCPDKSKDVFELCEMYLQRLEEIIQEGQAKGALTP
jgi:hypothetical protein